jgi:hypothetical protein
MTDRAIDQIAIWHAIANRAAQNAEWTKGITEKASNAKDAKRATVINIAEPKATMLLSSKANGFGDLVERRNIANTNSRAVANAIASINVKVEAMLIPSRVT